MEGLSIIIPVFNKIEVTRKCLDHIREFNQSNNIEIIVVDNGSTDDTDKTLTAYKGITYIRNSENLGISKACNRGAQSSRYGTLCFMHNDVFIYQQNWAAAVRDFILRTPRAGTVGFYGAKTLRKDASFRGKTILHSLKGISNISKPFEKVAVIDGLFMALDKKVFEEIGGFNEEFSIHYYDKDLSVKAIDKGFDNYVLNLPVEHLCNTTRQIIEKDDDIRDEAQKRFLEIWKGTLPINVTTWRDQLSYLFKRKK